LFDLRAYCLNKEPLEVDSWLETKSPRQIFMPHK
jgi:hypothetical protein